MKPLSSIMKKKFREVNAVKHLLKSYLDQETKIVETYACTPGNCRILLCILCRKRR
jgi:hypothetical protein